MLEFQYHIDRLLSDYTIIVVNLSIHHFISAQKFFNFITNSLILFSICCGEGNGFLLTGRYFCCTSYSREFIVLYSLFWFWKSSLSNQFKFKPSRLLLIRFLKYWILRIWCYFTIRQTMYTFKYNWTTSNQYFVSITNTIVTNNFIWLPLLKTSNPLQLKWTASSTLLCCHNKLHSHLVISFASPSRTIYLIYSTRIW